MVAARVPARRQLSVAREVRVSGLRFKLLGPNANQTGGSIVGVDLGFSRGNGFGPHECSVGHAGLVSLGEFYKHGSAFLIAVEATPAPTVMQAFSVGSWLPYRPFPAEVRFTAELGQKCGFCRSGYCGRCVTPPHDSELPASLNYWNAIQSNR